MLLLCTLPYRAEEDLHMLSVLEIFLGLSAYKCTTNMQGVAILMSKIYSAFIYVTMYSVAKTDKQRVLPKIKNSSAAGRVFKGKTKKLGGRTIYRGPVRA